MTITKKPITMTNYNYFDFSAGQQTITTKILSEIIKYIEDFPCNEDADGIVKDGDIPILHYTVRNGEINWSCPVS